MEATSEKAFHQTSFSTSDGGSAKMPKPSKPKSEEEAAPVPEPAGESKPSSEAAAVVVKPAAKGPARPKGGGSTRKRFVYRPKKAVTKKEEEDEPSATGEPGVADEAPLPKQGLVGARTPKQ